jgi:hypothetical protein
MTKPMQRQQESRRSILNELKTDVGAVSLESVITEIAKFERLRSLGVPNGLFDDVSPRVVERFQASTRKMTVLFTSLRPRSTSSTGRA